MNSTRNDYTESLRAANAGQVHLGLRPLRSGAAFMGHRPLTNSLIRPVGPRVEPEEVKPSSSSPVLLRSELGEVLRLIRTRQGRTLRDVSTAAQVSLGYLSEVERGQKEASSELLGSICRALRIPLWFVLREVTDRVAAAEGSGVPDTVPDNLGELASI